VNKRILLNRLAARKRRLAKRLDKLHFPADLGQPVLRATNIQYELAERSVGTSYGGIGLVHQLVREVGLAEEINSRLHLFKLYLPYRESDHVLNLAYNALCAGSCLQDLELRRQDEAYPTRWGPSGFPTRPRPATSAAASVAQTSPICKRPSTPRGSRFGPGSRRSFSARRSSRPTGSWW